MEVMEIIKNATFPDKLLGEYGLTIGIAGLVVRVEGLSQEILKGMEEKYAQFITKSTEINHSFKVGIGSPSYLEPSKDGYLRIEEESTENQWFVLSADFVGVGEKNWSKGYLLVSTPEKIKFTLIAIENYMRWVYAELALEKGGFIFHSCGLAKNGYAYVFFGPSGAGKSTIAGLSKDVNVLSDDLVLIIPEGNDFVAATTPFFGTLPQNAKDCGIYKLKGLYRLRKSEEARLSAMSKASAVGLVLACCPFIGTFERRNNILFPIVNNFLEKFPCYELFFRKDDAFWDLISEKER